MLFWRAVDGWKISPTEAQQVDIVKFLEYHEYMSYKFDSECFMMEKNTAAKDKINLPFVRIV